MERTTLEVDGSAGTSRVELRGRGPEILLLHGLSANRRVWDPVAARLAARCRLCLPDLPGRGDSEPRPGLRYGLAEEVDRLQELMERLPFRPRLIVGHSHGAALAAAFAARDARIEGLVLLNPVTPWTVRPALLSLLRPAVVRRGLAVAMPPLRRPLARFILRRVYGPGRRATAADVERYASPYADAARALELLRALGDWEPASLGPHLPERPIAGVVLAATHDRRIGLRDPGRLADRLGLRFAIVRGMGHALPEEAPAEVERAVTGTLAALDAAGRETDARPRADARGSR